MAHLAGLNLPSSVTLLEAQIDKRKAAGQVCAPSQQEKSIRVQLGSLCRGSRRVGALTPCGDGSVSRKRSWRTPRPPTTSGRLAARPTSASATPSSRTRQIAAALTPPQSSQRSRRAMSRRSPPRGGGPGSRRWSLVARLRTLRERWGRGTPTLSGSECRSGWSRRRISTRRCASTMARCAPSPSFQPLFPRFYIVYRQVF